jgi:hypothetical protein
MQCQAQGGFSSYARQLGELSHCFLKQSGRILLIRHCCTLLLLEEVDAESKSESYIGVFGVVFNRLLIINRRLNGDGAIDEKRIANLYSGHDIIVVVIGMFVGGTHSKIDAILNNVITSLKT